MQTLLLSVVLALGGADVYRWVDADGVVHYSDRPRAGAERVVIQAAPGVRLAPPPASAPRPGVDDQGYLPYKAVTIASPAQDEVLWNIEGQLDVAVTVNPPLQAGHTLQLFLDGQPAAILAPGTTGTRLSGVFRGGHTLVAEVLDTSGSSLFQSETLEFSVRQTSVENPVNPLIPPAPPTPQPRPRP
jgi:hypothetical protein